VQGAETGWADLLAHFIVGSAHEDICHRGARFFVLNVRNCSAFADVL